MTKSETVAMKRCLFGILDFVINSLFAVRVPVIFPAFELTALAAFGCIEDVKWLALCMLLALECSCTTIANRRDLYSPQPSPELDWHRQTTATTTNTHGRDFATTAKSLICCSPDR